MVEESSTTGSCWIKERWYRIGVKQRKEQWEPWLSSGNKTSEQRSSNGSTQLLIAMIKPHKPVSSSTVGRWLKTVLKNAGIDKSIFKAHSVRSAATSSASEAGVTTATIFDAGQPKTVFQRFYYKPKHNTTFGHAVLSQLSTTDRKATNSRWYGDRAFWNIITEWLRPSSGRQTLIMYTPTVPGRLAFCAAYNIRSGQQLFGRSSSEQSDPRLEYACPVWSGGNTSKLVKLQELFCRRHQIVLPQFQQRFDYHTSVLFYKIKSNLAPPYLTELLPQLSSHCGYNFRKNLYPVPAVKKSSTLTSFFPRSINLWNSLPSVIQSSTSLPKFKAVLRAYLKV